MDLNWIQKYVFVSFLKRAMEEMPLDRDEIRTIKFVLNNLEQNEKV